jgi:hypothetical protein
VLISETTYTPANSLVCVRRVNLRELLAAGSKDVIYPVLKWVVPQAAQLEKRAYVGYYMTLPEVLYGTGLALWREIEDVMK